MVTPVTGAIARHEPFAFGELAVTFDGEEAVIHGPRARGSETAVDGTASALRHWVRFDHAGCTGRCRALAPCEETGRHASPEPRLSARLWMRSIRSRCATWSSAAPAPCDW